VSLQRISHYEILEKIGEGGMGVVSLARDTRLGRQVAVKILRASGALEATQRQRFVQEAQTASSLNHPNIITIYDIESVDGVELIAMEYIRGKPLSEVVGRRGLPAGETLRYAVQITQALEAAHAAGIVHRDIKPANIMVTETGIIKVLDFGLAKLRRQPELPPRVVEPDETAPATELSHHTAEGVILGTLSYMSPEQASGKAVDARSDIFSFGVVLYEMLTGRQPFEGESPGEVISAILRDEPPLLRSLAPRAPRELERIVNRCLRKDPNRRFQDMADLRVALEELKDELDSGKLPAMGMPEPGAPAPARNWRLAAFALLVMGGLALFWLTVLGPRPSRVVAVTRLTSDPGLTMFPAISPDGTLVAYASDRAGAGNLDIWVQQFGGGQPIRISGDETDEYEPDFSPDGSQIVFRSERDGGGIYVVQALGGEPRLVVRYGRSPAFSPDGRHIAFAVGPPGVGATFAFGSSSLYVVPVHGGEPRRLAPEFAVAHHPKWSEDGRHILFEGSRQLGPAEVEICGVAVDSGAVTCTGVLEALRQKKLSAGPLPFAVHERSVVVSVGTGDSINLWRVRLTRDWRQEGEPEQLTSGTGQERQPSVARNGRMVFSSALQNTDVWELPVDGNQGVVTGEMRQLTRDAADDYYPEIAANGSRIAFISTRSGNDDVWLLDPKTGRQGALLTTPAREMYPKLSADGTAVIFGSMEGNRRGVYMMSTLGGAARKLCDDCGLTRDVTNDASKVVLQVGAPAQVGVLDVATGSVSVVLKHPQYPIYAPRLGPRNGWMAFQMAEKPTARVIYVAPFRGNQETPVTEWVEVTDGSAMDRNPAWSPDGSLLYFLSERDAFRCIWAQRLEAATRKPVGRPFAVAHFHQSARSLMNIDGAGQVSLSVAPSRIVFAMGEFMGNVWMAELR
jgi:Tol biopolymer transport system component/predicted Ser/Thr protein kinase